MGTILIIIERIILLFIFIIIQQEHNLVVCSSALCAPRNGMTKQQCQHLQNNGCAGKMAWVGVGCKRITKEGETRRANDGGCQLLDSNKDYCGFTCKEKCRARKNCIWTTSNQCIPRGCRNTVDWNYAPFINRKNVTDFKTLQVGDWSKEGVTTFVDKYPSSICGIIVYITTPFSTFSEIQLSQVELSLIQSIDNESIVFLSTNLLLLTQVNSLGYLGNTPAMVYGLRYEFVESSIPIQVTSSDRKLGVLYQFPKWKNIQFSLLSKSSSSSSFSSSRYDNNNNNNNNNSNQGQKIKTEPYDDRGECVAIWSRKKTRPICTDDKLRLKEISFSFLQKKM